MAQESTPKHKDNTAFHKQQLHRISGLADGIFAIIMTLLVLDIHVPIEQAIHSEHDVVAVLITLLPKILSYLLSFLVAGLFWSVYVNQYNYIKSVDRNLNTISLFYFMFCALLPFTTSFLAENIHFKVACALYSLNILIFTTMLRLHWMYAYRRGLTHSEEIPISSVNKSFTRRANFALISYTASIGLSFLSADITLCCITIFQLYFAFNGFIGVKRKMA